ncbi:MULTISPECIES: hypothetical protein [Paenibacillus]|uniref:hypothetical protein n=1 Tax=Paenibacillus TaxID=44249 RepID=UPI001EEC18F7|nr:MULTISPECIES: hypothetical protein [Paenibacillus]
MEKHREIEIVEMTFKNKDDYELKDYPFMSIGRLISKLENGEWSYQEELFEQPYESKYPENKELDEYIDNNNNIAFLD